MFDVATMTQGELRLLATAIVIDWARLTDCEAREVARGHEARIGIQDLLEWDPYATGVVVARTAMLCTNGDAGEGLELAAHLLDRVGPEFIAEGWKVYDRDWGHLDEEHHPSLSKVSSQVPHYED